MIGSPGRALIGAAAFFTLALFVFGSALVRAMGSGPSLALPSSPPARDSSTAAAAASSLTMEALMLAVENDPFTPERTRAAERYRLPGDVDPEPPPPPPEPPPVPEFLLSGTVVTSDGGLALIQVGESEPRMLALGDALEGYRLVSVTASGAVMSNEERQLQLRVPSPARVAQVADGGRGNDRNARNERNVRGRPSVDPRQMQQLVERARAAGATPQMIEAMMRMIQERGLTGIEAMEVGPNGFSFRSGNTTVRSRTAPPPPQAVPDTMELRTPRAPQLR